MTTDELKLLLPEAVRTMVIHHPEKDLTKGIIRRDLLIAVDPTANTTDLLMGEISKLWNPTTPLPKESIPSGQVNRPPTYVTVRNIEVMVEADLQQFQTERRSYAGSMDIPINVFREGEDAIREYIQDNYQDMDYEAVETDYGDSEVDAIRFRRIDYPGDIEQARIDAGITYVDEDEDE